MNFKTHAPARREETTLQPNIHISPIPFSEFLLGGKKIYRCQHVETRRSLTQRREENLLPETITGSPFMSERPCPRAKVVWVITLGHRWPMKSNYHKPNGLDVFFESTRQQFF